MTARDTLRQPPRPFSRGNRGSVLMVALILAGVIAISLTSFMNLTLHASKMANRSFYMDGAQNLCDLGLDHALWSLNNSNWSSGGNFALRSGTTNQYQGTFPTSGTYYQLSGNVKGQVKVWADLSTASRPHVIAEAIVTLPDGSKISKMAEAYMKEGSYFDDGMVGDTITFKGKVKVNSWNSDPNGDGSAIVPYSSGVSKDNGEVGATAVTANALSDGQGKIYGYAAAGSAEGGGGITTGAQGSIGTKAWVDGGNTGLQSGHATYDFVKDFPDVVAPTPPGGVAPYALTSSQVTLPRRNGAGVIIDSPASDGYYYYTIAEITLTGNGDTLAIDGGKVIITTTNTTGTTIKATGNNSGITISNGSSLKLYTAGNVSATGNGILNGGNATAINTANQPISFQLYGTRSAATAATSGMQTIDVKGNGYLSGLVYAPNADVTVNGNGDMAGAVIGNSVTMTGNADFHYDESLADMGGSGLWKIRKWREISTASERATYVSQLSF